ncbi:hypothetical protein [Vagococcus fluvialis]|uniref:hypothetical protein n=1 Tax=Vagococcus fluvialis TaxID=2738 RepID=UPI001D09B7D5|nr:hypothetical protein [Vagococcus fluvialis]UDM72764.1 hypothetical protein K5L00_14515 [Vagococcus fluvialis]UDM78320.1 hypothetical protein K5K98_14720 [Vagococcus fluvialis]UDM84039.1 hypothetical protein K5K96_14540 [Vagococcus fluvialis]
MTDYKFSIGEIIDDIVSYLEDEPTFYGSELHDNVFNTDYYIIGTYKAEKALEEYGTYKAIGEVIDYEEFHFGKRTTDLSNAENVANMLYYIKASEYLANMSDKLGVEKRIYTMIDNNWNNELEEEDVATLLEEFKGLQEDFGTV